MSENTWTTVDYGTAAYAQNIKNCVVEQTVVARGRSEFVIHLNDNAPTGTQLATEYVNSRYYLHDVLVKRFKQTAYLGGKKERNANGISHHNSR